MSVPEGLVYQREFITMESEQILLDEIDELPWGFSLKRRVQHYGFEYDNSGTSKVSAPEMPRAILFLANHLVSEGILERFPNQVTVDEYTRSQGVKSHKDHTQFGPTVATLTLGDDALVDFTRKKEGFPVLLERRSLAVLKGPARYEWTYGISNRVTYKVRSMLETKPDNYRRVSITFRYYA